LLPQVSLVGALSSVRAEIESVQEIERVIALFEKVDLEHNGKVDKGTHTAMALFSDCCLGVLNCACRVAGAW
jgi:hypothetical protein